MIRLSFIVALVIAGCTRSSAPPAQAVQGGQAAPPSGAAALPPLDDTCAADADCAWSYVYLVDGKCCGGTCSPRPASKASVKLVEQACSTLGFAEENCPAKKCLAPPRLKCVAGHCAAGAAD